MFLTKTGAKCDFTLCSWTEKRKIQGQHNQNDLTYQHQTKSFSLFDVLYYVLHYGYDQTIYFTSTLDTIVLNFIFFFQRFGLVMFVCSFTDKLSEKLYYRCQPKWNYQLKTE